MPHFVSTSDGVSPCLDFRAGISQPREERGAQEVHRNSVGGDFKTPNRWLHTYLKSVPNASSLPFRIRYPYCPSL
jgi:hypothetical protein